MTGDLVEPGTVNHPYCRYEKDQYGASHLTFYRNGSLSLTFSHDGTVPGLSLLLTSLTPPRDGKPGSSPINILLNRKDVTTKWEPGSSIYTTTSFALTPHLIKGPNLLKISLDSSATSCWWLRNLKIISTKSAPSTKAQPGGKGTPPPDNGPPPPPPK
jgi:hypothetical protein